MTLPLSCSLWTGGRSELTRLANLLTTGPEDTGVALLEVGASSVGDEAEAEGSPEVSEGCFGSWWWGCSRGRDSLTLFSVIYRRRRPRLWRWPL